MEGGGACSDLVTIIGRIKKESEGIGREGEHDESQGK